MKTYLRYLFLAIGCVGHLLAASPLHSIKITKGASFEVVPQNGQVDYGYINVYGLSERMKPAMKERSRSTVEAADYAVGLSIRTKEPKAAIQQILAQVSAQSGRSLVAVHNSSLVEAEPTVMLMALDADSVWFLVLSPREAGIYHLSCAYLIDEMKKG